MSITKKIIIALIAVAGLTTSVETIQAQATPQPDSIETVAIDSTATDSTAVDSATVAMDDMTLSEDLDADAGGLHHQLKQKLIDG